MISFGCYLWPEYLNSVFFVFYSGALARLGVVGIGFAMNFHRLDGRNLRKGQISKSETLVVPFCPSKVRHGRCFNDVGMDCVCC